MNATLMRTVSCSFLKTCYFTSLPVITMYCITIENDVFSSVFKKLYCVLHCRAKDFTISEEPLMMAVVNFLKTLQVWHTQQWLIVAIFWTLPVVVLGECQSHHDRRIGGFDTWHLSSAWFLRRPVKHDCLVLQITPVNQSNLLSVIKRKALQFDARMTYCSGLTCF